MRAGVDILFAWLNQYKELLPCAPAMCSSDRTKGRGVWNVRTLFVESNKPNQSSYIHDLHGLLISKRESLIPEVTVLSVHPWQPAGGGRVVVSFPMPTANAPRD